MNVAYKMVDWVRLVDASLSTTEIRRVTAVVSRLYPPALRDLSQSVAPSSNLLWDGMAIRANSADLFP